MKMFLLLANLLLIGSLHAQYNGYDSTLRKFASEKKFSGVVLVAVNGSVQFRGSSGIADREKKVPVSLHSQFKIASMSKVFTAVMTMKLVQEGKIDLGKVIGDYYPGSWNEAVRDRNILG